VHGDKSTRPRGRAGWDVEANGLFVAPPVTVIVSDEAHPTLFKSLGVLGLGRSRVVRVGTDGQGRMRADRLPEISGPTILCLQAGNVNINTGAFDPLRKRSPNRIFLADLESAKLVSIAATKVAKWIWIGNGWSGV